MMKRTMKNAIVLLCTLVLLLSMGVPAFGGNTETTEIGSIIEFGSYPQTEIVSEISDSGVYGKTWAANTDCIADASLYDTLANLPENAWNDSGDATVNGNKYRRIKSSDATSSKTDETAFYNWSSTDTYHYFKFEPIQWRVLKLDGNDIFILSETVLDAQMYNTNITGTLTWENSTIRSWLNGYDSSENEYGTDYSSNNFINTAFTSKEQSGIKITALENKDNSKEGTEGGNDTSDRIFFLSEDETYGDIACSYGFASSYDSEDTARQAKSSTYAKAMGIESDDSGYCFWWLRTPGTHPGLFIMVYQNGKVFRGGKHANSKSRGVRPAMHIDADALNEECTVTFNSNGGSEVAAQSVTVGECVAKPTAPLREGYSFNGWYSDAGLTSVYDFSAPVTVDTTLYAGWTENTDTDSTEQDDTDKISFFQKIINFFKNIIEKIKNLFAK